ncbi:MAG: aminotransferase class I/II-fold pyridoxal phosphate-dependent enzyme [Acidobacteriota bacterium]|nr:aminotransferase class I/II-fold pyridoxal phosphate-dependent enzyme [Acidobacteriota bacterium]
MDDWKTQTKAVHVGERDFEAAGATVPPIYQAASYAAGTEQPFSAEDLGEKPPFTYSRWNNPTVVMLEEKLAAMDGGEAAVCFASGMAAITGMFFQMLQPGDHLVCTNVCYPGVLEFLHDFGPRIGVDVTRVDASHPEEVAAAIRPETRLVFIETPANPILRLADITAIAEIAHQGGALLAVDNTFGSPIATRPLSLGADLTVYSLTKYHGGHGDALGGVVIGQAAVVESIRRAISIHLGPSMAPMNAWLISRGLATLPLRMEAHQRAAMTAASFLENDSRVKQVTYPGLPSHPQHELARRQMDNFSGMITFRVDDPREMARQFDDRFQIIHYAVSLGHHKTLCYYVDTADMNRTTFHLEGEHLDRYKAFAGDGVFRLSVGIEDGEDLIRDLDQALG